MTTKLANLAQIKRAFRPGGSAKPTLLGAAGAGGLMAPIVYHKTNRAKKKGVLGVSSTKAALASGLAAATRGAHYGYLMHLQSRLAHLSTLYKWRHLQNAWGRSQGHFHKEASLMTSSLKGAAVGGVLGTIVGSGNKAKLDRKTQTYTTSKASNAAKAGGALAGIFTGAMLGSQRGILKEVAEDLVKRRPKPFKPFVTPLLNHRDILKDFEAPQGFKTKSEAKSHYRKMMSQYHPDKNPGINPATSQKINKAWDDLQKTEYFEKLAHLFLSKRKGLDRA
jgi:hypothetical protein